MKAKLLLSVLLAVIFFSNLQAKAVSPEQGMANESILSQVANVDTIAIPWQESFEELTASGELPTGMTKAVTDPTKSTNIALYLQKNGTTKARTGNNLVGLQGMTANQGDWLFSPAIFLRAGVTYYYTFWYTFGAGNTTALEYSYGLYAAVGSNPTIESMTRIGNNIKVTKTDNEYRMYIAEYTPQTDGLYYFGIQALRTYPSTYLSIDDIELSTGFDYKDLFVKLEASKIRGNYADVWWYATPTINKFVLQYKPNSSNSWTSININDSTHKYQLSALLQETDYQSRVGAFLPQGNDTIWSDTLNFKTTKPITGKFPIYESFDGTSGINWVFMNDYVSTTYPQLNKWYIGGTQDSSLKQMAFISNTQGKTNTYDRTKANYTYMYTEFDIPDAEEYFLSFKWRAQGERSGTSTDNDYLSVVMNGAYEPKVGSEPLLPYRVANKNYLLDSNWNTQTMIYEDTLGGSIQKLSFGWIVKNTASGKDPAAAIDDIVFEGINCGTPKAVRLVDFPDANSLQLACKTYTGNISFDIMYRDTTSTNWLVQKGNTSGNTNMDSLVLKNLTPQTVYEIKIQKRCGTDTSFWSSNLFVKTAAPNTEVLFLDDFETFDSTRRIVVNKAETNKWEIGNAVYSGNSGKAMYVSNDGGVNNQYKTEEMSASHFYYDIKFPDAQEFILSFDWKGVGSIIDFMRVFIVNANEEPQAGESLLRDYRIFGKDFYNRRTWAHEELVLPKEFAGKLKRLVFTWKNSGNAEGLQPPVVIDNISVKANYLCTAPQTMTMIGMNATSLAFMCQKLETGNAYDIKYKKAEDEEWLTKIVTESNLSGDKFSIDNLQANQVYEIKYRKRCGDIDTSVFLPTITTRTPQTPATLPFVENFKNPSSYRNWVMENSLQTNHWTIDSAGIGMLYITDLAGKENRYDTTSISQSHCFRDIYFPEAENYELIIRWKGTGESSDNLTVYLESPNNIPQAGNIYSFGRKLNNKTFYGSNTWKEDTLAISAGQIKNSVRTLIFTWSNNAIDGGQPPIAISDIRLKATKCSTPTHLEILSYPDSNSAELQFLTKEKDNKFVMSYTAPARELTGHYAFDSTHVTPTFLEPNTNYIIKVQNVCAADSSLWSAPLFIRTPQQFATLPFSESFEDSESDKWTIVSSNPAYRGKWYINSASYEPTTGSRAAYIDSLDGTTNCAQAKATFAYMYRDIQFPEAKYEMPLSFQIKAKGIINRGFLKVFISNLESFPSEISSFADTIYSSVPLYFPDTNWHDTTLMLPVEKLSGKQKRLIFHWYNDKNPYTPPTIMMPATIDNITITAAQCPTPKKLTVSNITSSSAKLSWSCDKTDTNNYKFTYNADGSSLEPQPDYIKDTTIALASLNSNTVYNIELTNECGGQYNTKVQLSFRTLQMRAETDYVENFSDPDKNNEWTFVSSSQTAKWYMGLLPDTTHASEVPDYAAYISSNKGVSNTYINGTNVSHIYRDIVFTDSAAKEFILSFDWRAMGDDANLAFMRVYITDTNVVPKSDTLLDRIAVSNVTNLKGAEGYFNKAYRFQNEVFSLGDLKNKTKRLVFSWRNNGQIPINPPAAVSNISITGVDCVTPMNPKIRKYLSEESVVVEWNNISGQSKYLLRYREVSQSGAPYILDTVTGRFFDTLRNLRGNNYPYEIEVQSICDGRNAWSPRIAFNTWQTLAPSNFSEDFEDSGDRRIWTIVNGKMTNKWYIDTAVHFQPEIPNQSAYISNDGGKSNEYTIADPTVSIVHLYRDIDIPQENKEILISFDWKGMGYPTNTITSADFMYVYLLSRDTVPVAGVRNGTTSLASITLYKAQKVWQNEYLLLDTIGRKNRNRLLFTWSNNTSNGAQPATALDNIAVNSFPCFSPKNVRHLKPDQKDAISLKWALKDKGSSSMVRYRENGSAWIYSQDLVDSSFVISGIEPSTEYEIQIQEKCGTNQYSAWSPIYKVETVQGPTSIPFYENFDTVEKAKQWTLLGENQINKWYIGTAAGSSNAAYISDSNGAAYRFEYQTSPTTISSHIFRDVTMPPAPEYMLCFDWKGIGYTNNAYMYVTLWNTDSTLEAGKAITTTQRASKMFYGGSTWKRDTILLRGYSTETLRRLIFSWYNSGGATEVTDAPLAFDNIELTALNCKTPDSLKVVDYPDLHSVKVKSYPGGADTFQVAYKKTTETTWQYVGARGDTALVTGLDSNTFYQIKMRGACEGAIVWSPEIEIKTLYTPIDTFPYEQDFENGNTDWVVVNGASPNEWQTGYAAYKEGNNKATYISNDGGVSNTHSIPGTGTAVHFYKDIHFPQTGTFELFFDWRCIGTIATNASFLQISMTDITYQPIAQKEVSFKDTIIKALFTVSDPTWKEASILFPDSLKGKRKRLIFSWRQSGTSVRSHPGAIDNIRLLVYHCGNAANVESNLISSTQASLTWTAANATSSTVQYKPVSAATWKEKTVLTTSCMLDDLMPQTYYQVRVMPNCISGIGRPVASTFLTPYEIPYFDKLETVPPTDWMLKQATFKTDTSIIVLKDSVTPVSSPFSILSAFANDPVAEKRIKISILSVARKDWLITPPIYIEEGQKLQLEFTLALTATTKASMPSSNIVKNDNLSVFISSGEDWSKKGAVVQWDNMNKNREFNTINYTREGTKVKVPLNGYSGIVRFGFFVEAPNSSVRSNDLFFSDFSLRPYECDPVETLKITGLNYDAAVVNWVPNPIANQYKWDIRHGAGNNPAVMDSVKVVDYNSLNLTKLDTNQTYNVFVRSICEDTIESSWETITFTTLSPCAKITDSSIVATPTDTSAVITWSGDELHKSWEIRYGSASQEMEQMQSAIATQPTFTINGLQEESDYSFFMRATCENNDLSNWTTRHLFKTKRTPCLAVSNIVVSDIQINSATVSWSITQPTQSKWEVRHGSHASSINAMTSTIVTNKNLALPNLIAGKSYDVAIRAICRPSDSSEWVSKEFTTRNCEKISNLSITRSADSNTALVNWAAKQGHTAWEISISEQGGSESIIKPASSNSYVINYEDLELSKDKNYYVAVRAKCGEVLTDWSEAVLLQGTKGIDALANDAFDINLSPNPAKEFTKLSISGVTGEVRVHIYTLKGELVMSEKLTCVAETTKELTIKGLQRGAYTVNLIHEKWTRTEKLIVL